MFGWLKNVRRKVNTRSSFRYPLAVERLEGRDTPAATVAPTLTFNASIVAGNWVSLTGRVTCADMPMARVNFSGIFNASTTPGADGYYSVAEEVTTLGTINAQATDGGQSSPMLQATITSNAPTITLTRAYGPSGSVLLSGHVTDEDEGGRTVNFSGAVNDTVRTDGNGNFTLPALHWALGNVSAQTVDPWGLVSNTATVNLANAPPLLANFTAIQGTDRLWTFQGQVTDEYAAGLPLRLTGVPTLDNTPNGFTQVMVDPNGWFQITLQLQPGERGTVSAQAFDWLNAPSNIATAVVNQV